jgi:hypothetical protein
MNPVKDSDTLCCYKRECYGDGLIYRVFKVSGSINLDTFQDKVLQPVMGWCVIT